MHTLTQLTHLHFQEVEGDGEGGGAKKVETFHHHKQKSYSHFLGKMQKKNERVNQAKKRYCTCTTR